MLNKLHVNLEKSCFMYFNQTTSCAIDNDHEINPPIMIGSTEIKRVSKIKFLGVLIDEKTIMGSPCQVTYKKVS